MNIELWYDSVAQETDIKVNGKPVEKNDIFGFLYPIRNYPLQNWLYSDGSWSGFEYQLTDLAREEEVNIVFHGREVDFRDLEECLKNNEKFHTEFCEWDICKKYDILLDNLVKRLKENDVWLKKQMNSVNIKSNYKLDFNIDTNDCKWYCDIYDDSDFVQADDNKEKCCCYVHESFFTAYEKLNQLHRLTRSLKMPGDGIYCCFEDESKKNDYQYYARTFPRMRFRFVSENEDYTAEPKIKYGMPYKVKLKIKKCKILFNELCEAYANISKNGKNEYSKLCQRISQLNNKERIMLDNYKKLLYNIELTLKGIEQIKSYVDILFSVSKENKEEVFHYECIDKLNEKIETFLKLKTN